MIDQAFIFIPIADMARANNYFATMDPDTGGDKTFGSVRLSPSGNEPATYTACNTVISEANKTEFRRLKAANTGWDIYLVSGGEYWARALSAMGLKTINVDITR